MLEDGMLKLYRLDNPNKEYWETWDEEDGSFTIHWGELGTTSDTKTVKDSAR